MSILFLKTQTRRATRKMIRPTLSFRHESRLFSRIDLYLCLLLSGTVPDVFKVNDRFNSFVQACKCKQ